MGFDSVLLIVEAFEDSQSLHILYLPIANLLRDYLHKRFSVGE